MQVKKTSFISGQNLFLLLFSLVFFSLTLPAGYAGSDIDASWHEALIMAIEKNFIFGRDFIFNYGPLGYLNTGLLPKTVSPLLLVAVEIFILLNYLIIIRLAFQKAGKSWWMVAVSALLIFMPWGFIADTSFTLFYFFLFWLLQAKETRNTIGLIVALILSVLIFYVKVNLSIIIYGVFFGSLVYFWLAKFFTLRTVIIVFVLQVLLTYSFSFILNVDIPAYLQASLKIIDAYQDAMATMILDKKEFLPLLVFEGLILLVAGIFMLRYLKLDLIYLYLLIALTWFLCFKQAHTAVGHYNIFGFFLFMPPLAVLLYLFTPINYEVWAGRTFIIILCLQLSATQLIRYYMGGHTMKGYLLTYPPTTIAQEIEKENSFTPLIKVLTHKNPYNFVKRLVTYDYEDNFKHIPVQFPADLLKKVGNSSIDILPHQISYLFFNRLNYNPRPVIQSYQANSDWLMKKNGDKYSSITAPAFVLFHTESFREQHAFWVETDISEALLKHYKLTDTTFIGSGQEIPKDTFFVFEKQKTPKTISEKTLQTTKFKLNEDISLPKSGNLLKFSANISYSLKGKLARLLFQPPYLYCLVTYQNGRQENFRVIDKILRGGVYINPKLTTQAEAANFFLNKGIGNTQISKIRFWAKYEWGYEKDFEGSLVEVSLNN